MTRTLLPFMFANRIHCVETTAFHIDNRCVILLLKRDHKAGM